MDKYQLSFLFLLLPLQLDLRHLMKASLRKLLFNRFCVFHLSGTFQQRAQLFGAILQLFLLIVYNFAHPAAPDSLSLTDLLDEVDCRCSHQTRRILKELRLKEGKLQNILGQMLIFGLQTNKCMEDGEEFVSAVHNQVKIQLLYNICLFVQDFSRTILKGAASHQLLHRRHLISFFKFSSDVKCGNSYELQFRESSLLGAHILVDEGDNGEEGLGEHFIFIMKFDQPVDEFGPLILRDSRVRVRLFESLMCFFFLSAQELEAIHKVFGDQLGVIVIQSRGTR